MDVVAVMHLYGENKTLQNTLDSAPHRLFL